MNILPQLSLNAHHQTTKTMSIVDANGIRLSKDCNTLEVDNLESRANEKVCSSNSI